MRKEQPKISLTSESSKRGSMRNESLEGEFNTLTSVMEEYSSTADLRSFICLLFCKRTYTTQDQLEFCFYFSATNLEAEANKILQDFALNKCSVDSSNSVYKMIGTATNNFTVTVKLIIKQRKALTSCITASFSLTTASKE